jgi:hypothetical protein
MEESLEMKEKIKLLPLKLKGRAKAFYQSFQILSEVAEKSPGVRARIIKHPFTAYREKYYDYGEWRWRDPIIEICIHPKEGLIIFSLDPQKTGEVDSDFELFEILVAFEEQEERYLEWLSQILNPLLGEGIDLTAEFIKTIDTKLQEKAEKIYCYRYEGGKYPKTYIKFRQLPRTERATPAFSFEMYDYETNKLLIHIYFNSATELVEAIKHLVEGFQYLERKTTEEFPFQ